MYAHIYIRQQLFVGLAFCDSAYTKMYSQYSQYVLVPVETDEASRVSAFHMTC